MKNFHFGGAAPVALPVYDPNQVGAGVKSDLLTDGQTHTGSWYAIQALGQAGTTAIVTVQTSTIKTLNQTPPSVVATALAPGQIYRILSLGTTDFTQVGAAVNAVGQTFQATGPGTGTGTAVTQERVITNLQIPAGTTIFGFFEQITCQNGTVLAYQNA